MSSNVPPPPPPPPSEPPAGGYGEATPPPPPPLAPPAGGGGYSVGNAFSYGWSKFTQHLGQILLAIVVLVAVLIAIQLVGFFIGRAVACEPEVTFTENGIKADDCGGIFIAAEHRQLAVQPGRLGRLDDHRRRHRPRRARHHRGP